jgi:hypothetical protein
LSRTLIIEDSAFYRIRGKITMDQKINILWIGEGKSGEKYNIFLFEIQDSLIHFLHHLT